MSDALCALAMQTRTTQHLPLKKNPLKNLGALLKLNPYAKTARRNELLAEVTTPPPPFPSDCPREGACTWSSSRSRTSRPPGSQLAWQTLSLGNPRGLPWGSLPKAPAPQWRPLAAVVQEKRRTAKAEKLEKIRKGEKGSTATHRTKVTSRGAFFCFWRYRPC